MEIKKLENGFLIENKFYFTDTEEHTLHEYINLRRTLWPNMNFGSKSNFIIDYPGEYDIQNISFNVHLWDENKLNYFIKYNDIYIAIIQNPKAVEKDHFENVEYCIFTDDYTGKVLEKMEYEWQSFNLNQIDVTDEINN